LALLILVTAPASRLLTVFPQFAAAMGCFERLQAFLLLPVVFDRSSRQNELDDDELSPIPPQHSSEVEMHTSKTKAGIKQAVITAEDVTICPTATSPAVLSHASFKIEQGSITALLGPTGSGKTILLRALLGELRADSGHISALQGPVAYCAQTPWMINLSVRLNICGPFARGTCVDEAWYDQALHACCLDTDISSFPQGDSTPVGSKGITLSGGQKHRVVSESYSG
jgi:ATP-binding cassette subfamily C (CFTR/MRP) protein 1